MKHALAPIALGLTLLAAACGSGDSTIEAGDVVAAPETTSSEADDPVSDLTPDAVVMIWTETGGCAQAGPNCFRYEVLADGTVNSYRENSTDVEVTAQVDQALVADFIETVNGTNVEELVTYLPAGEMTAAFDGVDYTLEAPFSGLNLSSVDVEFVSSEALFSAANDVVAAARAVALPETEMR